MKFFRIRTDASIEEWKAAHAIIDRADPKFCTVTSNGQGEYLFMYLEQFSERD